MQEGWETICAGEECFVYSPAEKCKKTTNPMSDNMPIDDEERFFHQLFVDYYPSLCTFACGYLGNEDAAQDVVQDVFFLISGRKIFYFYYGIVHYSFVVSFFVRNAFAVFTISSVQL